MKKEKEWLLREKYGGEKTEGFFADMERLKAGEPLAYIIGNAPFLESVIYLDSKPLIPRPETEYWVSVAIEEMQALPERELRVLDLCAGSGCIGIGVLKALLNARVDFVEKEVKHHPTILKNLEVNMIESTRATVLDGNLFEHVTQTYDFILTNPPYIDKTLKRTDENVIAHEPAEALWGGNGGMEYIEEIINKSPQYLNPGGVLYLEHEPEQAEDILRMATVQHFEVGFFPDQFGIIRYTRAQY